MKHLIRLTCLIGFLLAGCAPVQIGAGSYNEERLFSTTMLAKIDDQVSLLMAAKCRRLSYAPDVCSERNVSFLISHGAWTYGLDSLDSGSIEKVDVGSPSHFLMPAFATTDDQFALVAVFFAMRERLEDSWQTVLLMPKSSATRPAGDMSFHYPKPASVVVVNPDRIYAFIRDDAYCESHADCFGLNEVMGRKVVGIPSRQRGKFVVFGRPLTNGYFKRLTREGDELGNTERFKFCPHDQGYAYQFFDATSELRELPTKILPDVKCSKKIADTRGALIFPLTSSDYQWGSRREEPEVCSKV